MLTPWLELPGATDQVEQWSKASGLDLVRLGTTATAEEITDTSITQPLVVALTLLAYDELNKRGHLNTKTTVVAGHSVGEIAAYAIAGVISADEAITLAATRGAEMAKACALDPTGMSAVLGGDEAEVLERLEALELVPANRNAVGQIVAAGRITALEKLAEDPPAKARVRQLATAGAFHPLHGPRAGLRRRGRRHHAVRADRHAAVEPRRLPVTSGADAMAKLVNQMTSPVRWDLCTEYFKTANDTPAATAVVELPPSGALSGIAKREMRGVPNHALKTPKI